jgi:hypothetical protein
LFTSDAEDHNEPGGRIMNGIKLSGIPCIVHWMQTALLPL